jgi:uncharacterized membrane protein YeaQ/YmgE (transglycosylase-associated protein family)
MSDVILWLVIGLVAGGVASLVLPGRSPDGVLQAIIIGTLGGVFGGFVLDAFEAGAAATWLGALGVAVIGAVVLLHVMRSVDRTARI